jgi:hypothetical protein
MYDAAVEAIEKNLLYKSSQDQLWYFAEMKNSRVSFFRSYYFIIETGFFKKSKEGMSWSGPRF